MTKAIVYRITNKSNNKAFVGATKRDNLDVVLKQKINRYLNKVERAKKAGTLVEPDGKLEKGFQNEGPFENFIIEKINEYEYTTEEEMREKMWNHINNSGYIETGYNEPPRNYIGTPEEIKKKRDENIEKNKQIDKATIKIYKIISKANENFIMYDLSRENKGTRLAQLKYNHIGKTTELGKEMRLNTKDVIQIETIQEFPLEQEGKANEELKKLKGEPIISLKNEPNLQSLKEVEKTILETEKIFDNFLNTIVNQIKN